MSAAVDDAAAAALARLACLGDVVQCDVALGPMTTYRVGGPAAVYVRITDRSQLAAVADAAQASGLPVLVVGRGSNLLVADAGFAGLAIGLGDLDATIDIDVSNVSATASAGVALPVLARKTAAAGLTGFEWAVGVPGSVGGAVRMNAGGHGSDMAASLVAVTVLDLDDGIERTLSVAELGLGFRSSSLPPHQVVLDATMRLERGDADESARLIGDIVSWRRANQPGGQNAGSVFVNPVPGEVSAGALIDAAGLRGHRLGTAVVSEKHANFIQADDGGRADDVRALMAEVRDRVEATSGYRLRSEIRLVGFDEGDVF
ncbi:MAG TPA: UDP-N-acetylmuramate dehydrogenase [Ilumatobacteraceae bacterium]|nr:UDP-N-acetylmuramate dehydrogenase [Ilumatobacteraceae bacterium]